MGEWPEGGRIEVLKPQAAPALRGQEREGARRGVGNVELNHQIIFKIQTGIEKKKKRME